MYFFYVTYGHDWKGALPVCPSSNTSWETSTWNRTTPRWDLLASVVPSFDLVKFLGQVRGCSVAVPEAEILYGTSPPITNYGSFVAQDTTVLPGHSGT